MPVRLLLVFVLVVCFLLPSAAQQPATAPLSAAQLFQGALAALTGSAPIKDVTLTGTARRIAGSDDDTGTAAFKALVGTGSRLDLSLSSGTRSEIRNTSGPLVGSWSGPDGVAHAISYHNLLTDIGVFPAFALGAFANSSTPAVTYIAAETREGQAVQHISAAQKPAVPDPPGISFAHLTEVDYFFDSTTLLPAAITFNIHPDNNALLDLPVEIRFSDYRSINGAQIPFHVQKFLNNSLILDLQFQSAALNTGLTASDFTVGAAQ